MRRHYNSVIVLAVVAIVFSNISYAQSKSAKSAQAQKYAPNRIIVVANPDVVTTSMVELVDTANAKKSLKSKVQHGNNLLEKFLSENIQSATALMRTKEKSGQVKSGQYANISALKAQQENEDKNFEKSHPKRASRINLAKADLPKYHIYTLELKEGKKVQDVLNAALVLKERNTFLVVQPDYVQEPVFSVDDTLFDSSRMWGLFQGGLGAANGMSAAWDRGLGDGVVVAVVDTGVEWSHEDLSANIWNNSDEALGDQNGDNCPGACGVDEDGDTVIDEDSMGCGANGRTASNAVCTYLNDMDNDDDENGFIDDVRGWDFTTCQNLSSTNTCIGPKSPDNNPTDVHSHGTHVSGTIAARDNNAKGVVGVAPRAKIMPVKSLTDGGPGYTSHLAAGILYAADNGADIINNSWGSSERRPSDPLVEAAVRYAYNAKGAVVVFAAGNETDDVAFYSPKNMREPIVVSALDQPGNALALFSNYGDTVDVAAPGVNILSTMPGNLYEYKHGTSMAAPHVAGLAALILSRTPTLTHKDIDQIIRASTFDMAPIGYDASFGWGKPKAVDAMNINTVLKAEITAPLHNTTVSTADPILTISGKASGPAASFSNYELFYGSAQNFGQWNLIGTFTTQVADGALGQLNVTNLANGTYYILLMVNSTDGLHFKDLVKFNVNRPERPFVRLTTDAAVDPTLPKISGNTVVWQDKRNINYDVYQNDLIVRAESRITTHAADQKTPAVSGSLVVWADGRTSPPSIYVFDKANPGAGEQMVPGSGRSGVNFPEVDQTRIVWQATNNGFTNIFFYDRSTPAVAPRVLSPVAADQLYPDISGDYVVWQDHRNGNWDVYAYNWRTNQEYKLSTLSEGDEAPRIDGNKVVWMGFFLSSYDIYVCDITNINSPVRTNITLNQSLTHQIFPDVSGSKVVWEDYRNGNGWIFPQVNGDIYFRDLNIGVEMQITSESSNQWYPTIDGNNIVWHDFRNGRQDIYMLDGTNIFPQKPQLTSPPVGSEITTSTVTFSWSAGVGATEYQLGVATNPQSLAAAPWGNIYFQYVGTNRSAVVSNIPRTGAPIYVRLWSRVFGQWVFEDYVYQTIDLSSRLTSPVPGSTLTTSSVTFSWEPGDGATEFQLAVATNPASFNSPPWGNIYYQYLGTARSVVVNNIPKQGNPIYVRLWALTYGQWVFKDYVYQTVDTWAQLTSPLPGSTLTSSSVTFNWNAGEGTTEYQLAVAVNPASFNSAPWGDVYYQYLGANRSTVVNNIPRTGVPIHVRLWALTNGQWLYRDYVYQTVDMWAQLASPAPGSTLTSSSVTFNWNAGEGTTEYQLAVAVNPASFNSAPWGDVYYQYLGTNRSVVVNNIPLTGAPVHVRLWALTNGQWLFRDHVYQTISKAVITTPTNGALLSTSSVTFNWTTGQNVSAYYLMVGSSPGSSNFLSYNGTARTATVTGIPLAGETIYARLHSKIDGRWYYNDYSYRMAATTSQIGRLTSHTDGQRLTESRINFQWSGSSDINAHTLFVGTTPGSGNLFSYAYPGTVKQASVNVPLNGENVYVKLGSRIGTKMLYSEYIFSTAKLAELTVPATGTSITASPTTFSWNTGTAISGYGLKVGTTGAGSENIYNNMSLATTSVSVPGLPVNVAGQQIFVRLFSRTTTNGLYYKDYVYEVPSMPAEITNLVPESSLYPGSNVIEWSAGSGVSQYSLLVTRKLDSPDGAVEFFNQSVGLARQATVNITDEGGIVYVRLGSLINGRWFYKDYSYQLEYGK